MLPSLHDRRSARPASRFGTQRPPSADARLKEYFATSLILDEDWEQLDASARAAISASRDQEELLQRLVAATLLNEYQAARLRAGKTHGLVLGNYRVLDRIGAGGMGVIYLAEHSRLRKRVAVKTLSLDRDGGDSQLLSRFYAEMRAVGQLHHPNVVSAIDAGEVRGHGPDDPTLHYFVMEYVPGHDIEALVRVEGAFEPARACRVAHAVADALFEAHRRGLVHRDIKPSNVLLTPEGVTKLLDFGLARHFRRRITEPDMVVGTIGYMAPEQATNADRVDGRSDIYSLGATLYWCLTGGDPFPSAMTLEQDIAQRITLPPPSVRAARPGLPAALDAVVTKMLAVKPEDRFADAEAVMRALVPFTTERQIASPVIARESVVRKSGSSRLPRILIIDDEPGIRSFCALALKTEGFECDEAQDGQSGLESLGRKPYDLVLLDVEMPGVRGPDVLQRLRATPPTANLKIVILSGRAAADEMAKMLLAGADDFLPKPFSVVQLRARVKAALRHKEAQDRSDMLNRHLLNSNAELERSLVARDSDLVSARDALVLALARLVEARSSETGPHLLRLQLFCKALGEEALRGGDFGDIIDEAFVQTMAAVAPLHDIGKVALPDHILMKPGKLDPEERLQMQEHTVIGAETLREVSRQYAFAAGFLQMAIDVARHHHERFDGTGYPDRLAGVDIPLAARFLAVADVYDALRSRRVYKPALPHQTTAMTMLEGSPGHFDPTLMKVFQRCLPEFERIFREASL